VTVDIGVGQMRQMEFVADAEGDWALHCHKSHHTMNAMGHNVPTMIGVDHRGLVKKMQKIVPDYMVMGERGMAIEGNEAMKTTRIVAAFAAAACLAPAAWGHGDTPHARKAGEVVREQKPWGIAGDPKAARIVEIRMGDDMRFKPDRIEVREGDTIRFVVRNAGKVLHEMVIGTPRELEEHAALMRKFPTMEHDEPFMSHVPAGKRGDITWNFNRPGTFQFACLIPGHFEAGMTGTIIVTPIGKKS
jgi:uncharacterized cupredoxin-like copper-binding protein